MQLDINQVLKVDPKMYRHFAVATLVLTALIALFADGDNRGAVTDGMERREQQAALRKAEAEKQGESKPVLVNRAGESRDNSGDGGGDFGSPTDRSSGLGFRTSVALQASPQGLLRGCGRALADRSVLAQMNERQREAYLAKLDEMDCSGGGAPEDRPHQPTPAEISHLAAASAARSGSLTID